MWTTQYPFEKLSLTHWIKNLGWNTGLYICNTFYTHYTLFRATFSSLVNWQNGYRYIDKAREREKKRKRDGDRDEHRKRESERKTDNKKQKTEIFSREDLSAFNKMRACNSTSKKDFRSASTNLKLAGIKVLNDKETLLRKIRVSFIVHICSSNQFPLKYIFEYSSYGLK